MKAMAQGNVVYLCIWSGDAKLAHDLVLKRYPGIEIVELPHRRLRVGSFAERIRLLRSLRGRAVVLYFESVADFKHKQILECIHFLHRCPDNGPVRQQRALGFDSNYRYLPIGSSSADQHPARCRDTGLLVVLSPLLAYARHARSCL